VSSISEYEAMAAGISSTNGAGGSRRLIGGGREGNLIPERPGKNKKEREVERPLIQGPSRRVG